jgi:hypothetical protein
LWTAYSQKEDDAATAGQERRGGRHRILGTGGPVERHGVQHQTNERPEHRVRDEVVLRRLRMRIP